jgi:CRP/FNR family transcriptional regulator, cyclic AMP receptor protein
MFQTSETRVDSKRSNNDFLRHLSPAALREFDQIKYTSAYPPEAVLFTEHERPRGVYVVCDGEVKLSISSSEGKALIMRIARAGEVLGLAAAVFGTLHEAGAEVLRPCQIAFIRREDFLKLLAQCPELYRFVMAQVISQYQTACQQIRALGLSATIMERVAKLFLDWSSGTPGTKRATRTTMSLTHEEIAQLVGTTRETVTRAISHLRRKQLIEIHGSTLTIPSRTALENCANAA